MGRNWPLQGKLLAGDATPRLDAVVRMDDVEQRHWRPWAWRIRVMYPLRFEPLFKQYVWGGRRLGSELNKPIGSEGIYAESWEVADHAAGQSVVCEGPLAGKSLGDLVAEHGPALLGRHHPVHRFPLLFKFLDAHQALSVQVHPDDQGGALLNPPDLGKTEAWVVLSASPGSHLYAGLAEGVDRPALRRLVDQQTTEQGLHKVFVKPGDCIFLPAGTVHAIGPGLMIAEIQQSSNATFRLFDWNRVETNGQARELHIDQGMDAIDFQRGPVCPQTPVQIHASGECLVACDQFVLNRWRLGSDGRVPHTMPMGDPDSCQILAVLDGAIDVADPRNSRSRVGPVEKGQTVLVPAACAPAEIVATEPDTTVLQIHLP